MMRLVFVNLAIVIAVHLIATGSVYAESGSGAEHGNETMTEHGNETMTENQTNTSEECIHSTSLSVEHLYNVHLHKIHNAHLSIQVNVSLENAARNDGLKFKQILLKVHDHLLEEGGECRDGNHISQHAQLQGQVCPWEYTCNYNPKRFPAYIFQAVCKNKYWFGADRKLHRCNPVYYPITTLQTSECNPLTTSKSWKWKTEMVSVACA